MSRNIYKDCNDNRKAIKELKEALASIKETMKALEEVINGKIMELEAEVEAIEDCQFDIIDRLETIEMDKNVIRKRNKK